MGTETELKFDLAPRYAPRVLSHRSFKGARAGRLVRAHLLSVYYDTPRFDLWRARVSLRLRRTPAGWVQTVKWAGTALGGLHQRNEIEQPVAGPAFEVEALAHQPGLEVLGDERLRRGLKPLFVVEVERSTRMLACADGASIEASLDRGRVVCGTAVRPLCELELESKAGSALALFDVAAALMQDLPLAPAHRSKAERGYLLAGLDAAPLKARRVELDPAWDVGRAAASLVASGLVQVQSNADGMLAGASIEYLHQLRVGVRRLRSCMSMLGKALPAGALDAVRGELRWLGAWLGAARDWDVFQVESLPLIARGLEGVCDAAVLDDLAVATAQRAERARQRARRAWRSRRVNRLLLELGRVSAGGGFVGQYEAMREPVLTFGTALLTRRLERVVQLGKKVHGTAGVARLHALRIGVKKLRYAVEFFGVLYAADKPRRYRERLVKLQDCLGRICDAAAMVERVREAAPGSASLVDAVRGWSACAVYGERQRFDALWRQFRRSHRFW